MIKFEVGETYGAWDSAVPPIEIIKRTAKMCLVKNTETGNTWRMKIKDMGDHEEMTDTCVPRNWRQCYTYSSKFKEDK